MTEIPADATFDASDLEQVDSKKDVASRRDKAFKDVVASILSTPSGRAWLWSVFQSCHMFQTSFSGDALRLAFAEGERNVGLRLLAQVMSANPDAWTLMMKESKV